MWIYRYITAHSYNQWLVTFDNQDGRGGQVLHISVNQTDVLATVVQLNVTNHQIPWYSLEERIRSLKRSLSKRRRFISSFSLWLRYVLTCIMLCTITASPGHWFLHLFKHQQQTRQMYSAQIWLLAVLQAWNPTNQPLNPPPQTATSYTKNTQNKL